MNIKFHILSNSSFVESEMGICVETFYMIAFLFFAFFLHKKQQQRYWFIAVATLLYSMSKQMNVSNQMRQ